MNRYSVLVTSHFEKDFLKLERKHPQIRSIFRDQIIPILSKDPFNNSRAYPIAKLQGVPAGDGQYRIRCDRFRFRYDILGGEVYLKYCSLRNETTYK